MVISSGPMVVLWTIYPGMTDSHQTQPPQLFLVPMFSLLLMKTVWNFVIPVGNGMMRRVLVIMVMCAKLRNVRLTVMILSFRTDRSGQTVQTQITLLLIRVYTVCNSGCIFWVHYSLVKPSCSNFRVITANVLGVRIFRNFTAVFTIVILNIQTDRSG